MKRTKYIILIVLSAFTLGCEEQIAWPLNNQNSDLIVVEGVLTNEKKQHVIKLSKPYVEQNLVPEIISGAILTIKEIDTNNITTHLLTESPTHSGTYLTDSIRAVTDKSYTLTILHNNKSYEASDTQPPTEPMLVIDYSLKTDSTYILNFNTSGDTPNYIKHYLNWQGTDGCAISKACEAALIFYDLKTVDINQQFAPNQEVVEFPKGTIIIRKKYSVSNAYQEYLRGMLFETAWRGGLFDVYQANAASNLSEGAIGFFAVSTVLSDTTIIK